jgi:hypothetical protein
MFQYVSLMKHFRPHMVGAQADADNVMGSDSRCLHWSLCPFRKHDNGESIIDRICGDAYVMEIPGFAVTSALWASWHGVFRWW